MLDFSQFDWLTFDCYGTLIDWESGILGALRPILAAHHRNLGDEGILELYGVIEQQIEEGEYQTYRNVLRQCVATIAARLGFTASPQEMDSLPDSLQNWPPFPDSVAALAALKRRYKLAALTNCDDDLFAHSAKLLGNPFDLAVTAQQARSYKPAANHFRLFQERTGVAKERWLHVAQSLHHDTAPARALGLATVWVNRRAGKRGGGATPNSSARPDLTVTNLAELAESAGC
jgi:2-haloacid dehalogenase